MLDIRSNPIEKTASKSHICDNCGCNIIKGHQYTTERSWFKGSYDDDLEWQNGYMKTMRYHLSNNECSIAIRLVQDAFFHPHK